MSTPGDSVPTAGSAHESDSSSRFKAFWKKSSDKVPPSQDLKFVHQDPGVRRKKNRISRILKHGGTPSSQEDENESLTSAQKRRQQVYQAQKRHRNRQTEYVGNLEAEIARLQHLDAMVNTEKNALAHQNKAIKDFLSKQSIDTQLDAISLDQSIATTDDLSQLGGAAVDIRFDEDMGHERVFLDLPEMIWTSSEASTEEWRPKKLARHAPVTGDSWAALDFILALEWPCQSHVKHPVLNPNTEVPTACDQGLFHGHALTTTQAVFQSAHPSSEQEKSAHVAIGDPQHGLHPSTLANWELAHSEIDKLVELAELLELDEDFMTPAQAYSAVRETVPNDNYLRPTLEALKKPLGSLVQCNGFGAVMDSPMFWQHLEGILQSLQFTRPELGA